MLKINKKKNPGIAELDNTPITTVLGTEITFTGDIKGSQSIKIDGQVQGNIQVEQGIILGEKGLVNGNIQSKNIIIYGQVSGNIDCNQLIIKNSGRVNGDISTNNIEIEMGGKYNGKLKMNQPLSEKEK